LSLQSYDVVILGGGLAGLALSVQIKLRNSDISVLILEKRKESAPDAAFKVGESTIETSAEYFARVIDCREYLNTQQITKPGLRFYFSAGDNSDIARRVEIGHGTYPKYLEYQLDRGRFENHLGEKTTGMGSVLIQGATVTDISIDREGHEVMYRHEGEEHTVQCKWVVDATGRRGLLKRKLKLEKKLDHPINATWFRVKEKVDISNWSEEKEWQDKPEIQGLRWPATNHLLGNGYWVWLIPLISGSTSIGIVADERIHPLNTFNSFDKAMAWLAENESQCHEKVLRALARSKLEPNTDVDENGLMDFHVLKQLGYDCEQVYSGDRWCLVGEAAAFNDPFYSPGGDLIAHGNSYTTELIVRNMAGEDITERAEKYDNMYLKFFFGSLQTVYRDQYEVMGNAQVFTAKVTWDYFAYWCTVSLLFFQNKLQDLEFLSLIQDELDKYWVLNGKVQEFFVQWNRLDPEERTDKYVDQDAMDLLNKVHNELGEPLTDAELVERFRENMRLLEELARQLYQRASLSIPEHPETRTIDPYQISLDPRLWKEEGFFKETPTPDLAMKLNKELEEIWLPRASERAA